LRRTISPLLAKLESPSRSTSLKEKQADPKARLFLTGLLDAVVKLELVRVRALSQWL